MLSQVDSESADKVDWVLVDMYQGFEMFHCQVMFVLDSPLSKLRSTLPVGQREICKIGELVQE